MREKVIYEFEKSRIGSNEELLHFAFVENSYTSLTKLDLDGRRFFLIFLAERNRVFQVACLGEHPEHGFLASGHGWLTFSTTQCQLRIAIDWIVQPINYVVITLGLGCGGICPSRGRGHN